MERGNDCPHVEEFPLSLAHADTNERTYNQPRKGLKDDETPPQHLVERISFRVKSLKTVH